MRFRKAKYRRGPDEGQPLKDWVPDVNEVRPDRRDKPTVKARTVGEFVAVLSLMDQSLPVYTEGCDCWGEAGGVKLEDGGAIVLIKRADE